MKLICKIGKKIIINSDAMTIVKQQGRDVMLWYDKQETILSVDRCYDTDTVTIDIQIPKIPKRQSRT